MWGVKSFALKSLAIIIQKCGLTFAVTILLLFLGFLKTQVFKLRIKHYTAGMEIIELLGVYTKQDFFLVLEIFPERHFYTFQFFVSSGRAKKFCV